MMHPNMTRLLEVSKRIGPVSMVQLMQTADVAKHTVVCAKEAGYLAVQGRRGATYTLTERGEQRIAAGGQGLARMPKREPKHLTQNTLAEALAGMPNAKPKANAKLSAQLPPACFGLAQFQEWRALAVQSGESVSICEDCSHSFQAAAFMRGICHRQVWQTIKFGKGEK